MEGLTNKDVVDSNLAFKCPMYFLGPEADAKVRAVIGVLQIFELDPKMLAFRRRRYDMEGRFSEAVYWLATVIVRGSADLRGRMEVLMTGGVVGESRWGVCCWD